MKIRFAVPNNPIFEPIIKNIKSVCEAKNYEFFIVDEEKCQELFESKRVDVALLNPYAYAQGIDKGDYRILDVNSVALEGYTGLASVVFKPNLITIKTLGSSKSSSYMAQLAKIMLSERFDMDVKLENAKGDLNEILKSNDAAVIFDSNAEVDGLDVSEEWFINYETMMPYALWVTHYEELPEDLATTIYNFAEENLREYETRSKFNELYPSEEREGKIVYGWSQEFEEALEETMSLLFLRQLTKGIAQIKIWGRDIDNSGIDKINIDRIEGV